MPTTIHFPEKTKTSLVEQFNTAAETNGLFTTDLDMEFSGVKTVHIHNLPTYPLQDYNRSKQFGTGSRYGDTQEVGDEVQSFTMRADKSLSLSIDKGNKVDQFNMKSAGKVMKNETDQVIAPYLDKYRYKEWATHAGIIRELSGALSKANICEEIMTLHSDMLNVGVPDSLVLVIRRPELVKLKLSDEWVKLENCGGKSLVSGAVGQFDGMDVKPSNGDRLPADVQFMIIYKRAAIAPMKIRSMKAHVDPVGMDGDLLEFRMYHDAFVIGVKANGIGVAVTKGKVAKVPTFSLSGNTMTVTSSEGLEIVYTLDGSDPRYSEDAKVYSSTVTMTVGDKIRAYCRDASGAKYNSAVVEYTKEA